jgi:hypothetical protein
MPVRAVVLAEVASIDAARQVLDRFAIGPRLQHVRQFVWRGGSLRLQVEDDGQRRPSVCYALVAEWDTAVLEPAGGAGLVRARGPLVDGRWTRARASYVLRAGISLAVPSAIYIQSDQHSSFVPFLGRPYAQVEQAIDADLAGYARSFLSTCATVPQAQAAGAARLRQLGLRTA